VAQLPIIGHGGRGLATNVVCGYLICDHPRQDRCMPCVIPVLAPALAAIHASPERKMNLVNLPTHAQPRCWTSDSVTYEASR
jgi:hypothetical protein